MLHGLWLKAILLSVALCAASIFLSGSLARADDADIRALRERLDKLEKQNQELQRQLKLVLPQGVPSTEGADRKLTPIDQKAVEKTVNDVLKERDEKKKKEDEKKKAEEEAKKAREEAEGYKVGTDLKMSARWDDGVRFETPNKDFTTHIGARLKLDSVWWTQSEDLIPNSQLGNLQDGMFFRRIRLEMDGTGWEVIEWRINCAFEQINNNMINLDDTYAGITKLPVIGSVRIGHLRLPQGLEGDQGSSTRTMMFMERPAFMEALYQTHAPGLWTNNSVLDQRMTWEAMIYKPESNSGNTFENGNTGASFGDGVWATTGRLTGLPLYQHDGRYLVHLAGHARWIKAQKPITNGVLGAPVIQFQARPELRDSQGSAFGGDTARMVTTGYIPCDSETLLGSEFLAILGPFSLQSEVGWAHLNGASVPVKVGKNKTTVFGDRSFWGCYVQASYFLTGENRLYDCRLGRLANTYVRPFTTAWLVRNEDGSLDCGWGAWEIAARYSYLNLNDGPIQGGVEQGITIGLNWYLTSTWKIQFNWVDDARWHKMTTPYGTVPGTVQGFGIRTQLYF